MATIEEVVTHLNASRYVTMAGLTMLLYDHCLTFADEVEYIWKAGWKIPKILFLFLRYVVPTSLMISTFQMSGLTGIISDKYCQVWLGLSVSIGLICIYMANFLVLLHLWNICERKKLLVFGSLGVYVAAFTANVICLALAVSHLPYNTTYSTVFRICIMQDKKLLPMLWAPGLALDVVALPTVIYNALERPRDVRTEFRSQIFRDGVLFFAILFTLRLTNVLLAIYAPISLLYLGVYFIWASTTMTVTRMLLRLRRLQVENALRQYELEIQMQDELSYGSNSSENGSSRTSHQKQASFS
ncbi:hypothetical protein K435DRAFT_852673 [Dendrothele bispora CBS 962.96]|uniref:DUF6533 domain-containing protein n=1 Tax=Dendrothele bispora (strain CBS 962.96) TaxID=1314807 RepID=A0A4S8MIS4_DENBC|nr:hypothetical protein K435DRAFT_852673 [Dendrothele bispora CBS 962.96]